MTPELAAKRQQWFNDLKPGNLVIYNEWAAGYTNKPALILSILDRTINNGRQRPCVIRKEYIILIDEKKVSVRQDLLSPIGGWMNAGLDRSF